MAYNFGVCIVIDSLLPFTPNFGPTSTYNLSYYITIIYQQRKEYASDDDGSIP